MGTVANAKMANIPQNYWRPALLLDAPSVESCTHVRYLIANLSLCQLELGIQSTPERRTNDCSYLTHSVIIGFSFDRTRLQ